MLEGAGFASVEIVTLDGTTEFDSADHWIEMTRRLAGPAAHAVGEPRRAHPHRGGAADPRRRRTVRRRRRAPVGTRANARRPRGRAARRAALAMAGAGVGVAAGRGLLRVDASGGRARAPLQIFHAELGDADAPTMLLLHGFPTSSIDWYDVAGPLATEHRVCMLDFPGFGFSDKPRDGGYSLLRDCRLIEHYVHEILGADAGTVIAHDRGDSVALTFAQRCGSRRGRLRAAPPRAEQRQHVPAALQPDPVPAPDPRLRHRARRCSRP